ncbi:MAG: DUF2125 domain-containing protein [Octadecabacter sp.]|nr:DUF2125 domain-containing protein [Octadecabacter sp.]
MQTRLLTSFIALSTSLSAPVFADVTAADVWANQQAYLGALGINASGTLTADTLTDPILNIVLPMAAATLQITTDPVTFEENSDGSVTISYPSPMTLSFAGGVQGEGSMTGTVTVTHDGYTITATGTPGDVTYASDARNLRMEIGDLTTDGVDAPGISVEGFLALDFWTGQSRVTEGNLITYTSTSEVGTSTADFTIGGEGLTSQNTQTTLPIRSVVNATLPMGGSDLMNLSGALRDGLNVSIESSGEGSSSEAITLLEGELFNSQTTTTGPQIVTLGLSDAGLVLDGEAAGFGMVMNDPLLFPGDLEFAMEAISATYDIPLNASEVEQDFRLAVGLNGITMGDAIWNLFDPAGQLSRDPSEISFDVTGTGTSDIDLLDFAAMSQLMGPPPIEVDQVTIESLRIALAGAEATATGAMTFDWTDFQTIPGIARPEGQVVVNLNGANQLMDTLANMGLFTVDDLMMPRMMLGMFATPVGDDMLTSMIEVNDQGHVLANGQRLQ